MDEETPLVGYRCHPDVRWSVTSDGVTLVGREADLADRLAYPEACLWDLVSRGRQWDDVCEMVGVVAGFDRSAAEAWVRRTMASWVERGWLTRE